MHKLSHTGVKPHSCNKCGLALMTRSHLKRHQRVHSGEKRHECLICGKKFSERYTKCIISNKLDVINPNFIILDIICMLIKNLMNQSPVLYRGIKIMIAQFVMLHLTEGLYYF